MTPVLVLEDDVDVRAAIVASIVATPTLELLGEAADLAGARVILRSAPRKALAVFDLQLHDGLSTTLLDTARERGVEVLVLTTFDDDDRVFAALEGGAGGYLLKSDAFDGIGAQLCSLRDGGAPISPRIARRLISRFRRPVLGPGAQLTKREWEVVDHFSRGATYAEVATALGVSVNTVREHVRFLYEKLHVCSKAEAVSTALALAGKIR